MVSPTTKSIALLRIIQIAGFALTVTSSFAQKKDSLIINDITQLNPIIVNQLLVPHNSLEIAEAVKSHPGPIAIGGGRYSMGGQTATENALHIDMRELDSILEFRIEQKEITVQAGITWRKIQEFIDPYDLSVKIMQSYANFTVGGSMSVNVHGRYVGQGPVILSVKRIRMVLANGDCVTASPNENKELFYGAIGGYGGLGVITEATLQLTDNCKVKRSDRLMPVKEYAQFFIDSIRNDSTIIFHNANLYPRKYRKVRAVSYIRTDQPVTVKDRLTATDKNYRFDRTIYRIITAFPGGKWIRQHIIDPFLYLKSPVEWRNYEASYSVRELEPKSRKRRTYVLQEYFVPVGKFADFYPKMTEILRSHNVNVLNISIRHARKDPGSTMAWARSEVFAFVIYYSQGTKPKHKEKVKKWTQELIDAAISCEGTYYLPYQIHATPEQFAKAYPASGTFFQLKKQYDPTNKFRNKLWDAYLPAQ